MISTYLRKNDTVMVITGKEKGKSGRILRVLHLKSRAVVEKLNMVKVHEKPVPGKKQGGIIQKEMGIHLSNLLLFCSKCNRGVRISNKLVDGKKVRACKKCDGVLGS
jgi:large subunit ribosomal protein L24